MGRRKKVVGEFCTCTSTNCPGDTSGSRPLVGSNLSRTYPWRGVSTSATRRSFTYFFMKRSLLLSAKVHKISRVWGKYTFKKSLYCRYATPPQSMHMLYPSAFIYRNPKKYAQAVNVYNRLRFNQIRFICVISLQNCFTKKS